jgi:hypothetical protein
MMMWNLALRVLKGLLEQVVWYLSLIIVLSHKLTDSDIINSFKLVFGSFCLVIALCLIYILYYMIKNREVYERNHNAVRLLSKRSKGTLTPGEEARYRDFCNRRILVRDTNGRLRLSDGAIRELLL